MALSYNRRMLTPLLALIALCRDPAEHGNACGLHRDGIAGVLPADAQEGFLVRSSVSALCASVSHRRFSCFRVHAVSEY